MSLTEKKIEFWRFGRFENFVFSERFWLNFDEQVVQWSVLGPKQNRNDHILRSLYRLHFLRHHECDLVVVIRRVDASTR